MTGEGERNVQWVELEPQGKGYLLKEALITEEQLGSHCRMFSRVILKPGCELGYHKHQDETETYYILSGKGTYNDNGTKIPVVTGDVTFCDSGSSHGIENTGNEDLCFIALILEK